MLNWRPIHDLFWAAEAERDMQNEDFRSVGIVGTGWVGASVAISTLHQGVANEVILCDERKDVAEGEAMDLAHGSSFYPSASVRAGELGEMQNTDALVVCAGRGGRPNGGPDARDNFYRFGI